MNKIDKQRTLARKQQRKRKGMGVPLPPADSKKKKAA